VASEKGGRADWDCAFELSDFAIMRMKGYTRRLILYHEWLFGGTVYEYPAMLADSPLPAGLLLSWV
jgi:hypothetical protein